MGSHYKNAKELVQELLPIQKEDGTLKYDVTALVWSDDEEVAMTEADNFSFVKVP